MEEGRAMPGTRTGTEERVTQTPLALTTEQTSAGRADSFAAALRGAGVLVERRTFLPVPSDEGDLRRVLLLAIAGALSPLVRLIAPATAPPGVWPALVDALFPASHAPQAAALQLKARGVFVSLLVTDTRDLATAVTQVTMRAASLMELEQEDASGEHRVVYAAGSWEVT